MMRIAFAMALALTSAWPALEAAKAHDAQPPGLAPEAEPGPSQTAWLSEAKVGLMVHWGIFSVPARARPGEQAERILENEHLSIVDYEGFAQKLAADKFDPNVWPKLAKESGMGYLVVVAKHRDGFCLWNSAVEPFNSAKFAASKRDLLKELSKSCQEQGVRLGAAFAAADLRHPEYNLNYGKYAAHAQSQIQELFGDGNNYAIDGLWLIGEPKPTWPQSAIIEQIRELKPEAIVSVPQQSFATNPDGSLLTDLGNRGDFQSFESHIPDDDPFAANPVRLPWESRFRFGESWGWNQNGEPLMSGERMLDQIVEAVSRGGNALINVGANADGTIPEPLLERLKTIGAWMKVNGESIQGASPSPFGGPLDAIRVTAKGNVLYLFLAETSEKTVALAGLKTAVKSARVLDGDAELIVDAQGGTARIALPMRMSEFGPTVIKVELEGPPEIELAFP